MAEQPWYQDGLKFKCSGCGDCCTGAPGYVWVNKQEIAEIASLLELEVDEFERRHVTKVGIRKTLKERSNHDCVLFDNKSRQCTVYSARPRQCRTWPFWQSNLRTPEQWEQTCEECPGAGKGPLYSLEHIEKEMAKVRI